MHVLYHKWNNTWLTRKHNNGRKRRRGSQRGDNRDGGEASNTRARKDAGYLSESALSYFPTRPLPSAVLLVCCSKRRTWVGGVHQCMVIVSVNLGSMSFAVLR